MSGKPSIIWVVAQAGQGFRAQRFSIARHLILVSGERIEAPSIEALRTRLPTNLHRDTRGYPFSPGVVEVWAA